MTKDASPCPDKPIAAKITITRTNSSDKPTQLVSDSAGHFTVQLPPGDYKIQAGNPTGAPVPYAAPQDVTVQPAQYTQITVNLDSGVR